MGLFDFNRDGKTSFSERFFVYGLFMAAMNDSSSTDNYEWRDSCEDGFADGVDPEDYETEEEYMEALSEEKYGWREFCEDGSEYDIDPEEYETEDEYMEALEYERDFDF